MALADLFPDEDFRFQVTLRRGDPAEFFRALDPSGRVLAERRRWLAEPGERYLALDGAPGTPALVDAFLMQAAGWETSEFPGARPGTANASAARPDESAPSGTERVGVGDALPVSHRDRFAAWNARHEPDVLLLARDASDGEFHLRAGALCFPTAWALEEKLGRPMRFIHGPVPGLQAQLGPAIDRVLGALRPGGGALRRDNWGLAATAELNLHPARPRPRLVPPLDPARVWLRVERQALGALSVPGGGWFALRIELHPLAAVRAEPAARAGLRRALATMPEDVAAYKGVAAARSELLEWLS